MITLDLSILNQKGTPMFNSDTLANRPAAGIVGRIFIAIDAPFGIYRDTGSAWDQISGASTFSGSLATGQVGFGSATNTISGTNNLFWNSANNRLGIGTNTPTAPLQVVGSAIATAFGSSLFFSEGSNDLQLGTQGGTTGFTIKSATRNLLLYSGVLPGDNGNRLQVYGDTFLKGSGNTSATTALSIQDNSANTIFRVRNDNKVFVNQLGFGNDFPEIVPTSTGTYDINGASFSFIASQANYGLATYNVYFRHVYAGRVNTSGTSGGILQNLNFTPTSGTGVFNHLALTGNINQTGGANGISRGLYISPVITAAADFRSIQWDNNSGWGLYGAGTALNYLGGTLGIKTTSPYAPSTFSLDVNGGLLVKNTAGTTAQITLINADPSLGGNNGFLVASVGGTSGGSYVDFQGYYGTSVVGSTALRLNPAGGAVIVNSTTNSGEQLQLTGSIRVNGQTSATSGGVSGQHLIINCDGVQYKIELRNP